jgi:hypothetical protein
MDDRIDEPASLPRLPSEADDDLSAGSPGHPTPSTSTRVPESPVTVILVGFFVGGVLGGFLIVAGSASDVGLMVLVGYLLAVVGCIVSSVGIVAAGVRLGMRWARLDDSEHVRSRSSQP